MPTWLVGSFLRGTMMVQIRERRATCISRQRFVCAAETKEIEENPAENRGEELEVILAPYSSQLCILLACQMVDYWMLIQKHLRRG